MTYDQWREPHPSEFDELACPRCGRVASVILMLPRTGRARWCKKDKVLFDKSGILLDVLAEYDKEWLNGLE